MRELGSPASSGDEKELYNSKKRPVASINTKSSSVAVDSGLSEDHGSTGSSVGHPLDDLAGHQRSVGGVGTGGHHVHHHNHRKMLSIKVDSAVSKIRRPSSDSARSSSNHHDDLELVSPREIPLFRRNKSPDDVSSSSFDNKHDSIMFGNRVAGADDVSDGSRPGTPLCDERPEHLSPEAAPVRLSSHLRSSEPMSLPLPGFAAQVKATSPKANLASLVHSTPVASNSSTGASSASNNSVVSAVPCKKDRDPRLKSPTTPTSHQMFSLKSPTPSLKSPPGKMLTEKCPSIVVSPASHELGGSKPHDPRLGLLQLAPAPASGPKSPPVHANIEMEDISDGEKESVVAPVAQTLEERLKALDEKYEKWSGSARLATPICPSTPSSTPTTVTTPSLPSSTPVSSLTCPSSSSSSSSLFKFNLKPSQPSPIVQRLLARKSVFDEDSKRLENITEVYDNDSDAGKATNKNVSVGSVNFSAPYNNSMSVLSDKSPAVMSSPSSPAAFTSALPKDIPTMPTNEDFGLSVPPSLAAATTCLLSKTTTTSNPRWSRKHTK